MPDSRRRTVLVYDLSAERRRAKDRGLPSANHVIALPADRIIQQRIKPPNAERRQASAAERKEIRKEKQRAENRERQRLAEIEKKRVCASTRASSRPPNYREERDSFLASQEWRQLRYDTLRRHGAQCQACNAPRSAGRVMHVDHIQPMWTHWHLRADPKNLQVLCEDCNVGKGAWDDTDWRR